MIYTEDSIKIEITISYKHPSVLVELAAVHCVSMFGSSEARRTAMLSHAVKYNTESLSCRILWNANCWKILWNTTKGLNCMLYNTERLSCCRKKGFKFGPKSFSARRGHIFKGKLMLWTASSGEIHLEDSHIHKYMNTQVQRTHLWEEVDAFNGLESRNISSAVRQECCCDSIMSFTWACQASLCTCVLCTCLCIVYCVYLYICVNTFVFLS